MSLKTCKKWALVLLIVGLILGLTNFAQTQPKSGFAPKVGYFMPGDEDVEDIWGSDFTFGVDHIWAFQPYGIGIGAEYFSKEKKETALGVTAKAEWSVIPVTATFLYFLPGREGFSPYIGAGIGYYLAKVEYEVGWMGIPLFGASEEESDIGFHVQGGVTLGKNLFAEAKYSTADVEGVEAGGFTILVGFRF